VPAGVPISGSEWYAGPIPRARWFLMALGFKPQRAASWSVVRNGSVISEGILVGAFFLGKKADDFHEVISRNHYDVWKRYRAEELDASSLYTTPGPLCQVVAKCKLKITKY
jgi:hypothetical protein